MRNIKSGCRTKSTQAGNKKVFNTSQGQPEGEYNDILNLLHTDQKKDAFNY